MVAFSLLLFCRISIALLFLASAASKARALRDFEITVGNFKLMPRRWHKPASWLFLAGEIGTVVLMAIGGNFLLTGFLLTAVLLAIFAVALVSALVRDIDTSCNCFGKTERRISPYDVARNILFILCALSGLWMLRYPPQNLEVGEIPLLICISVVFVVLVANLSDVIETLLRPLSMDAR